MRRSAVVWRSGSARPGRPTGKSRGGRVARSSLAVLACMHARDVFPSSGGGGPLARVFFGNRDACRPWGPSFPVGKFVQSFHRRFKVPLPNVVAHQQRTRFARLLFVFLRSLVCLCVYAMFYACNRDDRTEHDYKIVAFFLFFFPTVWSPCARGAPTHLFFGYKDTP